MKIKKIAAVCKAAKRAHLLDYTDAEGVVRQWISNGYAAYPVDGMPYLETEHLITAFELTEKQVEKMQIDAAPAPETLDFGDTAAAAEFETEARSICVYFRNTKLIPVVAKYPPPYDGQALFIDADYLVPVIAEYDSVTLWLRVDTDGNPYFAVKSGMLLVGLVWPVTGRDAAAVAAEMTDLAARLPPPEEKEEDAAPEQMTIGDDDADPDKVDRPAADALAVKESLAMEVERFGDVREISVVEETPKRLTLYGVDNRSEGPRPKPTLPRGGYNALSPPAGEKSASSAPKRYSSEALEWIAKRRAKLNRWAATRVAEVVHPERGSVFVPYNSNLDAMECAAEYWGCGVSDISGAEVRLAAPGVFPVAMPW